MVGVQLSGGLGNQMFEYALYLKLKSMGKDVRIDDDRFPKGLQAGFARSVR